MYTRDKTQTKERNYWVKVLGFKKSFLLFKVEGLKETAFAALTQ